MLEETSDSEYGSMKMSNESNRRVANVEHLAAEREDTVVVAPNHSQARHGQGLGRVALSEDEGALLRLLPVGGVVRVDELGKSDQLLPLPSAQGIELLLAFVVEGGEDVLHNTRLGESLEEGCALQSSLRAEVLGE